ncbi:MAG: glucose 1-dehydrogenase [Gammaproteobacteria bacterium]|nr:glucose 1-dehydrogenase [Gammaproteobacteria bacterium]
MSSKRFEGKNIVVTGGNSGIGLAAAQRFVAEGGRVAIVGRNAQTLAAARESLGGDTIAVQADMSTLPAIEQAAAGLAKQMPHVDVLFANAGIGTMVPVREASEAVWDQIMNVNLKGMYFTVQKILPLMGRGGAIVLCSSLGAVRSWPGSSIYSASKAGVNSIGRALASELVADGIRVNVVMPGGVDTPIMERSLPAPVADAVRKDMASHTPMQRLANPEEIANAVAFLASDEASYMTGTETIVDGGIFGCAS